MAVSLDEIGEPTAAANLPRVATLAVRGVTSDGPKRWVERAASARSLRDICKEGGIEGITAKEEGTVGSSGRRAWGPRACSDVSLVPTGLNLHRGSRYPIRHWMLCGTSHRRRDSQATSLQSRDLGHALEARVGPVAAARLRA